MCSYGGALMYGYGAVFGMGLVLLLLAAAPAVAQDGAPERPPPTGPPPEHAEAQDALVLGLAPAADYSPVYPTRTFPSEATEIAAIFRLAPGETYNKLTASWIAVETGGAAPPNHVVMTREQRLAGERVGAFLFRTNAAPPGKHRIEVQADGKPWKAADFEIVAMADTAGPMDAEDLFPLATGTTWTYNFTQEAGEGAKLNPPPGVELDAEGRFRATVFIVVSGVDSAGAHLEWRRGAELIEEEWLRMEAEGLVRTQRAQEGTPVVLDPPELLLPLLDRRPPGGEWDAPAYDYELRYRMWGPLPIRGPDGVVPGYVTLAVYPPPFNVTVERHYLPGVGLVREVLIAARDGRRLERRELALLGPPADLSPEPLTLEGADTSGHLAVFFEQKRLEGEGGGMAMEFVSIAMSGEARLSAPPVAIRLSPEEVARLRALFEEVGFDEFQGSYGQRAGGSDVSQVSIFYYGGGSEKTVTWHHPPSEPGPPAGWKRLVAELERIRERLRTAGLE
jgi:hypothetical protein